MGRGRGNGMDAQTRAFLAMSMMFAGALGRGQNPARGGRGSSLRGRGTPFSRGNTYLGRGRGSVSGRGAGGVAGPSSPKSG